MLFVLKKFIEHFGQWLPQACDDRGEQYESYLFISAGSNADHRQAYISNYNQLLRGLLALGLLIGFIGLLPLAFYEILRLLELVGVIGRDILSGYDTTSVQPHALTPPMATLPQSSSHELDWLTAPLRSLAQSPDCPQPDVTVYHDGGWLVACTGNMK